MGNEMPHFDDNFTQYNLNTSRRIRISRFKKLDVPGGRYGESVPGTLR